MTLKQGVYYDSKQVDKASSSRSLFSHPGVNKVIVDRRQLVLNCPHVVCAVKIIQDSTAIPEGLLPPPVAFATVGKATMLMGMFALRKCKKIVAHNHCISKTYILI